MHLSLEFALQSGHTVFSGFLFCEKKVVFEQNQLHLKLPVFIENRVLDTGNISQKMSLIISFFWEILVLEV